MKNKFEIVFIYQFSLRGNLINDSFANRNQEISGRSKHS